MTQTTRLRREDASLESTWNREALYPSWAAWDAEYERALAELPALRTFAGRLSEGPTVLLDWLQSQPSSMPWAERSPSPGGTCSLRHRRAVADYLAFLQAGASRYPLDLFRLAGVDMTSPEPAEQAFAALAGFMDRLEELTG